MKKFSVILVICLSVVSLQCSSGNRTMETSVLVIGGTTGGISAGLQSARMNVPTLIVEETTWLGGMITAAGVSAIDGNHRLPSGIWNEFRAKLRNHYGGEAALSTGWVSNTLFEPHVGDSIFKAMAASEKNLSVVYGFHLAEIIKEGNRVTGAVFINSKNEKLTVKAKIVVDATDLGDGLAMAGAAYNLGMESSSVTGEKNAPAAANAIVQDLTWVAVLKDYGPNTDKTIAKPAGYNPEIFKGACSMTVDSLLIDCQKMITYGKLPNNKYMINWPRRGNDIYLNVVEMDYQQRLKELQKAKEKTLDFIYFIQTELGFKNLGLADDEFPTTDKLALVPYHREGRRLKGIVRFTINNVLDIYSGDPLYRTGISVGDYPVDHHHGCNPEAPEIHFPPVPSFSIPVGALIPEKVDGLVVADKAISVSNIMNGATRLQPCVLLTGQAAGALAALSVKTQKFPRAVNIRQLQQQLLSAGVYLLPLVDVTPADREFQAIQRVASSGILKVKGEPYKWANRTWFFPDTTITVREFTEGLSSFSSDLKIVDKKEVLTLKVASEFLSVIMRKDVSKEIANVLSNHFRKDYYSDQALTKREISVVVDEMLKPFEKKIDFKGNYIL